MGLSLEVRNLRFSYRRQAPLLDGINLTLRRGEVLALLGPNGAGKTTLLRCLLGVNKVQHGEIHVGGRDLRQLSGRERATAMAYVPQASASVFPYRVRDIVLMGRTPHLGILSTPSPADERLAYQALDRLGIAHLADRSFTEISGGERQMTLIARALTQQSHLLILDEPTASLDFGNQVRILSVINDLAREGYAVLMTTHFPDHAFWSCSSVALMKDGQIFAHGPPDEILTDDNLSQLYAVRVAVVNAALPTAPDQEVKVCVPLFAHK